VNSLSIQVIRTVEQLHALESEWRGLVAAARLTLPFRTFEWNASWWSAFAEDRATVKDVLAVRTFRDASTGHLIAIAPLALTLRPARGPFRTRTLQPFGADPNITEIRGLVCAERDEARVIRALMDHLSERASEWDWAVWAGLRPDSEASNDLTARNSLQWTAEVPRYRLALPDDFGQLRASVPRNLKESLRKCYNSLRRDGHAFELAVLRTWEEVEPALVTFRRLHAARAARTRTVQHLDVFASPNAQAFLRDVCRRFASHDAVRLFALRIGGRVVAMRLGFVTGDCLYLYYSGFDPAWGKYSVMTTCLAEALKWAIREGHRTVDLSTGNDVSKMRWRPVETMYREALQLTPHPRGVFVRQLHDFGRKGLLTGPIQHIARRLLGRRAPVRWPSTQS
jgi:CelD/BcsL family acetyltransferase involved in cellulose biosynthesis